MNYDQSVRSLFRLGRELGAPRQARLQKWGLKNIAVLAAELGNPHLGVPCVHVAGTNGKGSTAAMLESILRSAGLRTGLYTSPHLQRINERIRIEGEDISDADFAAVWTRVAYSIESLMASGGLECHPTFFECVTAMAFLAFAERKVDIAIIEVGMGGRFDATNIVEPEIGIITPIDFDHENFLGHSIEEIAGEKAGIIKPGMPVVSAVDRREAQDVIARRCSEVQAELIDVDESWRIDRVVSMNGCYRATAFSIRAQRPLTIEPSLPGRFQIRNALAAATGAQLLAERGFPVSAGSIARGIANVRWPGRLEKVAEHPDLYFDGTHNPAGARVLLAFWKDNFDGRRIFLVYGAMRDKAVDEVAGLLFPRADTVILTEPRQPRAVSAPLLAELTAHFARRTIVEREPFAALEAALRMANPEDAVFATGSLYLVGELREYWNQRKSLPTPAISGHSSR
jgi:dihydrofolate synthase / folylpolyglutamate synthase